MILEPCLALLLMKYLNSYPIRHTLNQWYANRVTIQPTVLADKLFTPPPLQINSIYILFIAPTGRTTCKYYFEH